ncbi:MAG: Mov34/MPN/PAD-1 family protein [Isosphaeraceae bacterium]|nr:Mov34/MPN/PAD-1 family protein [Isosphaeraceae bacterium]
MADSPPESRIDVRLLGDKALPRGEFPGGKGEVFRVYFAPAVHEALWKHASEDTSVEICGVLVGAWERDVNGPFVRITESIRGEAADNKFAEVTFTHETWAKINARMDTDFSHLSIVGWYHTHPDFGIFLSDRDRFIHEHFFSGAGQVAHVIDPVRKDEGVFVWREGKAALADHFWAGDRIVHAPRSSGDVAAEPKPGESTLRVAPAPRSTWTWTSQLLAYLALFLLGYVVSGFRSAWEDQMLKEGAVYHFGIWKGLRPGLREELDMVARDLNIIARAVQTRDAKPSEEKSSEKKATEVVTTAQILDGLSTIGKHVGAIKAVYGYSDTEQEAIRQLLDRADASARRSREEPVAGRDKASAEAGGSAAKEPPAPKPSSSK